MERVSFDPLAFDLEDFGGGRDTEFSPHEVGGEEIDPVGADGFIVLVHARPSGHGGVPIEVGEGGGWGFGVGEPGGDFEVGGEEGVGFALGEPVEEGRLFSGLEPPDAFSDFGEGFASGGLGLEKGGGEAAFEEGIDGGGEDEAGAFFSEGVELADGVEGGGVLIVGARVDGGRGRAGAEDNGDLVGDDGFGPGGESGLGGEPEKSDTLGTAGLEDFGQLGVSLEKRIVCPEGIDLIAEGMGAGFEAAQERAESVILFGEGFGDVEADEGEGAAVLGVGTGAKLAHNEGDHGIGAVAHFFGEGLNAASGGFADTGIVAEGEGDGGFADASGLGKVGHTEGLHKEEVN